MCRIVIIKILIYLCNSPYIHIIIEAGRQGIEKMTIFAYNVLKRKKKTKSLFVIPSLLKGENVCRFVGMNKKYRDIFAFL